MTIKTSDDLLEYSYREVYGTATLTALAALLGGNALISLLTGRVFVAVVSLGLAVIPLKLLRYVREQVQARIDLRAGSVTVTRAGAREQSTYTFPLAQLQAVRIEAHRGGPPVTYRTCLVPANLPVPVTGPGEAVPLTAGYTNAPGVFDPALQIHEWLVARGHPVALEAPEWVVHQNARVCQAAARGTPPAQ